MTTLKLPLAERHAAPLHAARAAAWPVPSGAPALEPRRASPRAHVVADPRAAIDPWLDTAIDWDATLAFRRHLWSLRLRRRRGDGHRAARDGTRLADIARAHPPLASTRARGHSGRGRLSGAGTDHLAAQRRLHARRRDRRLRGAMRRDRGRGRPHHPDGEPRARRLRALARRLRARLRPRARRRCASR